MRLRSPSGPLPSFRPMSGRMNVPPVTVAVTGAVRTADADRGDPRVLDQAGDGDRVARRGSLRRAAETVEDGTGEEECVRVDLEAAPTAARAAVVDRHRGRAGGSGSTAADADREQVLVAAEQDPFVVVERQRRARPPRTGVHDRRCRVEAVGEAAAGCRRRVPRWLGAIRTGCDGSREVGGFHDDRGPVGRDAQRGDGPGEGVGQHEDAVAGDRRVAVLGHRARHDGPRAG